MAELALEQTRQVEEQRRLVEEHQRLVEEQRHVAAVALPLLGALLRQNVRYSDSKHHSREASELKTKLVQLEARSTKASLRCMLLDLELSYSSVIASHLLKREWDYLSRELADVTDVEDVHNGLLLYKPLEW